METAVLEKTSKGYAVIGSQTGRQEYELCDSKFVHAELGVLLSASIDKTTGEIQWSHDYTSRIEDAHPDKWDPFSKYHVDFDELIVNCETVVMNTYFQIISLRNVYTVHILEKRNGLLIT